MHSFPGTNPGARPLREHIMTCGLAPGLRGPHSGLVKAPRVCARGRFSRRGVPTRSDDLAEPHEPEDGGLRDRAVRVRGFDRASLGRSHNHPRSLGEEPTGGRKAQGGFSLHHCDVARRDPLTKGGREQLHRSHVGCGGDVRERDVPNGPTERDGCGELLRAPLGARVVRDVDEHLELSFVGHLVRLYQACWPTSTTPEGIPVRRTIRAHLSLRSPVNLTCGLAPGLRGPHSGLVKAPRVCARGRYRGGASVRTRTPSPGAPHRSEGTPGTPRRRPQGPPTRSWGRSGAPGERAPRPCPHRRFRQCGHGHGTSPCRVSFGRRMSLYQALCRPCSRGGGGDGPGCYTTGSTICLLGRIVGTRFNSAHYSAPQAGLPAPGTLSKAPCPQDRRRGARECVVAPARIPGTSRGAPRMQV